MKKYTKLSVQWFYELLEKGECDIMDFKEQLEDKNIFGKSIKNFAPNYEEMARDVVAFANKKGGFLFLGIVDKTKEVNKEFVYTDEKIFDLIKQIQDRTKPTITLLPHRLTIDGTKLLVLEIPFSMQMHSTSRGEYLVRSNNGNKIIEPHEMATIMSREDVNEQKVLYAMLVAYKCKNERCRISGMEQFLDNCKVSENFGEYFKDAKVRLGKMERGALLRNLEKDGLIWVDNDVKKTITLNPLQHLS